MPLQLSEFVIVSDLDGTLLTAHQAIPERNLEAIERFRNKGGRFTIATGRSVDTARAYAQKLHLDIPAILCNGTMIYDFTLNTAIHTEYMDETAHKHPAAILREFPHAAVEIFSDSAIHIINTNEYMENFLRNAKVENMIKRDGILPEHWNKILIADSEDNIKKIGRFLDEVVLECVYHVFTSKFFIELMPSNISKASGIKRLSGIIGCEVENIVAVGDFYNDIEMLTIAGIGAVPADAPERVAKFADIVVCNCDDGAVADVIEYLERLCSPRGEIFLD